MVDDNNDDGDDEGDDVASPLRQSTLNEECQTVCRYHIFKGAKQL